jgi:hypothetical protein
MPTKTPTEAIISRAKLLDYLLLPKRKNDKSTFLAQAGFTQSNPDALEAALRQLIVENEAYSDRVDEYGVFYRVEGRLHCPDGILAVVTVWILQKSNGEYRFVTLKPARQPR